MGKVIPFSQTMISSLCSQISETARLMALWDSPFSNPNSFLTFGSTSRDHQAAIILPTSMVPSVMVPISETYPMNTMSNARYFVEV